MQTERLLHSVALEFHPRREPLVRRRDLLHPPELVNSVRYSLLLLVIDDRGEKNKYT
jgi:hypothetical protein